MKNKISKIVFADPILLLVLLISFCLNTIGLYPNTLLHQNEPGLLAPASKLAENIVFKFNFDPNIEPDPFKYGSSMFYLHAFVKISFLSVVYLIKLPVLKEGFYDFFTNTGPFIYGSELLWLSRFVTSLFGVGSVFLIFRIAKKMSENLAIAHFSAFALAISPLMTRNSHYAMVDVPQVFFILLSYDFASRIDKNSIKSLFYAGFAAGYAISLKYFPISLLPLAYFYLANSGKHIITKKTSYFGIFIFLGYFFGMPYLFAHYDKILGLVPYMLNWYAPNQLEAQHSLLQRLVPPYFHWYHLHFLLEYGYLQAPLALSVVGLVIASVRYKKKILPILLIPVANSIFITFYLKQVYEQLSLPALPFLAIFTGVAIFYAIKYTRIIIPFKKISLLFVIFILIYVFYPPFKASTLASITCRNQIPEYLARDWIGKNIPDETTIAFQQSVQVPAKNVDYIYVEFENNISLAELQSLGVDYYVTTSGYQENPLWWYRDLKSPDKHTVQHQYANQVITETAIHAELLKSFTTPYMCSNSQIFVYKLPKKIESKADKALVIDLQNILEEKQWYLLNGNQEVSVKFTDNGIIYTLKHGTYDDIRKDYYFYYSDPLVSPTIRIDPEKIYRASLLAEPSIENIGKKDGYFGVEFLDKEQNIVDFRLSEKFKLEKTLQKISLTVISPKNASFLRVKFQSLGAEELSFRLTRFELTEE